MAHTRARAERERERERETQTHRYIRTDTYIHAYIHTHTHTHASRRRPARPRPMAATNAVPPSVVRAGAQAIAAGNGHSMVLKGDGTVWATGSNYYGQLGDGTDRSKRSFAEVFTGP